jgi:phage terminase large subunit
MDSARTVYVYKELGASNLPISEASKAMLDMTEEKEDIYATFAPPDMWSRSQETGRDKAQIFYENGLTLTKASNDREAGWLAIKELLSSPTRGVRLKIFSFCNEIIKCLPALVIDKMKPSDCLTEPHEITHAPDALRGFAIFYTRPAEEKKIVKRAAWSEDMWEDYLTASREGQNYLKQKYGEPL